MKNLRLCLPILLLIINAIATTYNIGDGLAYESYAEIPWGSITAGDSIKFHYREEPYREKWVIPYVGTSANPIVFCGVADLSGNLPVITGENAVVPSGMNFWNESRGVIKIGGSNNPSDNMPAYIIIDNLELRSARPGYYFTGRDGLTNHVNNAAAIYVEKGEHLIFRNCILHDCGNGVFAGDQSSDIVVEGCHIYDNGIEGSYYEHNNYTEAWGILFQFNHYGPLRSGCDGNNLKDRSAGTIIRYNWIESGNRQLDLVDSDCVDFYTDTLYRCTYVYGNILVEHDGDGNSQILHYGGDSGTTSRYRKGTLFLHNNTIISTRSGNTTLARLSSDEETCDARNNIIYTVSSGTTLAMMNSSGTINLRNNWLKTGWANSFSHSTEIVNDYGNITGSLPGFTDFDSYDFTLAEGSDCIDAGGALASLAIAHTPEMEYIRHCLSSPRTSDGTLDIGAYEYNTAALVNEQSLHPHTIELSISPNPFNSECNISCNTNKNRYSLEIYNVSGKLVYSEKELNSGTVHWDGSGNETGVYLVRASSGSSVVSKKIVYMK